MPDPFSRPRTVVSPLRRRLVRALPVALAAPLLPASLLAQTAPATWPARPVTITVPFPPGGGTDAFARPLFAVLSKLAGKQFVIDNRGGAGGTLGATLAARAAPDGHSFFMGAVHHAIAPSVYPKLDYDIRTDFVPVALLSNVPQVIVVNPQRVQAKTLAELLATLRADPGKLSYASAGNGTSHHLAGELFKLQTKTFVTHIPYRGAGPALQDLAAGQVDMMFDGLGSSASHIKSGRIRALAAAGERRAPGFENLPTTAEAGLPSYKVATWYGLFAPKGTPAEAIDAMQALLRRGFANDEVRTAWHALGSEVPNQWGRDFGRFVDGELQRWADVVKAANIKMD